MKLRLATTLLLVAALVVATFSATVTTTTGRALAAKPTTTTTTTSPPAAETFPVKGCPEDITKNPPCDGDNVILRWNEQLLSAIRAYPAQTGPTITARALGVLHTATYDAWAAYDPTAKVTRSDGPTQQLANRNTLANKQEAISYAAYRVLNDLFPPGAFPAVGAYKTPDVLLTSLGYSTANTTPALPTDTAAAPAGVGNLAAKAVLDFRHGDGSNQLNGYADTTGYNPANQWNRVNDRWRWQPLCVLTPAGVAAGKPPLRDPSLPCPDATPPMYYTLQKPLTPPWGTVTAFSLAPSQYEVSGPPRNADRTCCSTTEIVSLVNETSNLSDSSKSRAEYWADGPKSEFPPGHTAVFAQALSRKKGHNLDTDVKLFFLVGNAMMDASIAAWYQKYLGTWLGTTSEYDFVRPITAIREHYRGQTIHGAWKGPNQGFGDVLGEQWMPYQALHVVTPPFPEYVSGHSTFTAAGATMLGTFNGSDTFGASVTIKAHSSAFESNTPATDVTLTWPTFSDASNDAGMSRRWGGIHFQTGDFHGRALGRQVAQYVWGTGQNYIKGYLGKPGS
jgi:Domain of unknown function (DUF6851)/VCPO second helical-bundle domain/Vanadium chloroperoxidase N-terminal domain